MKENQVVRDGRDILTLTVYNVRKSEDPHTPLMKFGEVHIGKTVKAVYWSDLTERWSTY